MQDIGFFLTTGSNADLVLESGDLKSDDGLQTAVLISLFTDQRANEDEIPFGDKNPRGWWADLISQPTDDKIGSLLWTQDRTKVQASTSNRIQELAKRSLDWMIEDGVAKEILVSVQIVDTYRIDFGVAIFKPDGQNVTFKAFWDAQDLLRGA